MRKNSNNESDLPLTISSKDGLVDQISYFNKTVASKDMTGYFLLLNGEFAYNKSYSVGYDFGSIKRLDRYSMGALSTLYICFALMKYDSDFIKTYFDSLKWYREIYMIAAEGARNHGLLNVPTDDFFATKHILPDNLDEQKKIATFIGTIDRRIQAQQRLVDSLKLYKRGVASALFSQKLRLKQPDGSDYAPWSQIHLGSVFCERTERGLGTETLLAVTISNGVQIRADLNLKDNSSDDKQNYRMVRVDDLAYNTMRMWQGACGVSAYEGIVSPAYTVLYARDPQVTHTPFWAHLFKEPKLLHVFQRNSQGLTSDTWNLKYDKFSRIVVNAPSVHEQRHICSVLDAMTVAIQKQEASLNLLSEIKQGLMAVMFI